MSYDGPEDTLTEIPIEGLKKKNFEDDDVYGIGQTNGNNMLLQILQDKGYKVVKIEEAK